MPVWASHISDCALSPTKPIKSIWACGPQLGLPRLTLFHEHPAPLSKLVPGIRRGWWHVLSVGTYHGSVSISQPLAG